MKLNEAPRLRAIADALARHPTVLVRRRQVGTFLAVNCKPRAALDILARQNIGGRIVDIGQAGEPDLDVLVGGQACEHCGHGVHAKQWGVEIKSDTGKQEPSQVIYQREVVERRGLLYVLAREPAEACKALGLPYPYKGE